MSIEVKSGKLLEKAYARYQQGNLTEAAKYAQIIIDENPDHADAIHLLGIVAGQRGQHGLAIELIRRAIDMNPQGSNYSFHLGVALQNAGQLESAVEVLDRVIQDNPNDIKAHLRHGAVLNSLGRFDESLLAYDRVTGLNPGHAEAQYNRGVALMNLGRLQESLAAYDHAIHLNRDYADAHTNRGAVLMGLGRPDESLAAYEKAIQCNPGHAIAHYNRGTLLLMKGDFRNGWKEFEWRQKLKMSPQAIRGFHQPQWDGASLHGKTILLHSDQGFGDAIQFIRYLPNVVQSGGRVVLECEKGLVRLMSGLPGIALLLERGRPLPDFDVHAPLMSLPYIFGTTLETIPGDFPYLDCGNLSAGMYEKIGIDTGKRNIGIVWAGNPAHTNDSNRSIEPSLFSSLLQINGTKWFSLQVGTRSRDLEKIEYSGNITDTGSYLSDFSDTASVIKHLDLVISVDTAVVHLAGALGKPVWILLPYMPDWRWLRGREDSPWYPGARLFRQPQQGDWQSVFKKIGMALEGL